MQTVFIIEDDLSIRTGLASILTEHGYEVITAENFTQALAVIRGQVFDLALIDIMLPDGNGFDLCKEIRKRSDAAVIFLTALDEEYDIVRGFNSGGDDYVSKPFRLQELLSRIKALLRRTSGSGDTAALGGLILKKNLRELHYEDAQIPLTPTEFALASILLKNPHKILPRETLLQFVWDSGADFVEDNTLSVHISRLREKLASLPVKIQTVRGIGYKLIHEGNNNAEK